MTSRVFRETFSHLFSGAACTVEARAPGRVNLIGEHTDYSNGLVLPMATEQALHVLAGSRGDRKIRAVSSAASLQQEFLDLDRLPASRTESPSGWMRYVAGVAAMLSREGVELRGANLLIDGDLPIGAGLSSSAALEVGVALALTGIAETPLEPRRIAAICQAAEQQYAGTPCGIMDQFASLFSQSGHAMLLDCRDESIEHIAFPADIAAVAIIDTQVRHELAGSAYTQRVEECRAATAYFSKIRAGVQSLRDVTSADLEMSNGSLDSVLRRRAEHVVHENARVLAFVDAMRDRDPQSMGRVLTAGHASLRDSFEVSCSELNAVVDALQNQPGVYGARMTGGGFGGCVIALARPGDGEESIRDCLAAKYNSLFHSPAIIHLTGPGAGATVAATPPFT